jgi:hypothetical protein
VDLGPDAGPSLVLLAASAGLTVLWLRAFAPVRTAVPDRRQHAALL